MRQPPKSTPSRDWGGEYAVLPLTGQALGRGEHVIAAAGRGGEWVKVHEPLLKPLIVDVLEDVRQELRWVYGEHCAGPPVQRIP